MIHQRIVVQSPLLAAVFAALGLSMGCARATYTAPAPYPISRCAVDEGAGQVLAEWVKRAVSERSLYATSSRAEAGLPQTSPDSVRLVTNNAACTPLAAEFARLATGRDMTAPGNVFVVAVAPSKYVVTDFRGGYKARLEHRGDTLLTALPSWVEAATFSADQATGKLWKYVYGRSWALVPYYNEGHFTPEVMMMYQHRIALSIATWVSSIYTVGDSPLSNTYQSEAPPPTEPTTNCRDADSFAKFLVDWVKQMVSDTGRVAERNRTVAGLPSTSPDSVSLVTNQGLCSALKRRFARFATARNELTPHAVYAVFVAPSAYLVTDSILERTPLWRRLEVLETGPAPLEWMEAATIELVRTNDGAWLGGARIFRFEPFARFPMPF